LSSYFEYSETNRSDYMAYAVTDVG